MNTENTHELENGLSLSCLCYKHAQDSKCEVFLRNHWRFCDIDNAHEVLVDEQGKLRLEEELGINGGAEKYLFLPAYSEEMENKKIKEMEEWVKVNLKN